MIVGNSMAGQLAAMATFDVALPWDEGPKIKYQHGYKYDGGAAKKIKDYKERARALPYKYTLLKTSSAGKERVIRPMTVGGARAGNKDFQQTIDKFYTFPRYPFLRVINMWDLVPAFPAIAHGFALNQGGIVLPMPNYYTQGCGKVDGGSTTKAANLRFAAVHSYSSSSFKV